MPIVDGRYTQILKIKYQNVKLSPQDAQRRKSSLRDSTILILNPGFLHFGRGWRYDEKS